MSLLSREAEIALKAFADCLARHWRLLEDLRPQVVHLESENGSHRFAFKSEDPEAEAQGAIVLNRRTSMYTGVLFLPQREERTVSGLY